VLSLSLEEISFDPSEIIYLKGDIDKRIFFLYKGIVENFCEVD